MKFSEVPTFGLYRTSSKLEEFVRVKLETWAAKRFVNEGCRQLGRVDAGCAAIVGGDTGTEIIEEGFDTSVSEVCSLKSPMLVKKLVGLKCKLIEFGMPPNRMVLPGQCEDQLDGMKILIYNMHEGMSFQLDSRWYLKISQSTRNLIKKAGIRDLEWVEYNEQIFPVHTLLISPRRMISRTVGWSTAGAGIVDLNPPAPIIIERERILRFLRDLPSAVAVRTPEPIVQTPEERFYQDRKAAALRECAPVVFRETPAEKPKICPSDEVGWAVRIANLHAIYPGDIFTAHMETLDRIGWPSEEIRAAAARLKDSADAYMKLLKKRGVVM